LHKVNGTRYVLTQFGATSPTSRGIQARKEIYYNSISLKSHVNNLKFTCLRT